jgi:molybdopterin-guanine dinucleotide biosynthesis protein A
VVRVSPSRSIIGVILAGGQGRRLGGVNKSFLRLAGKPLLEHVIDRIRPQVREIVINTSEDIAQFQPLGCKVVADQPRTSPANGPLVGLTTVFSVLAAVGDGASFILSVPVDTPFLPVDLVARLSAGLADGEASVSFAARAGRDHPIIAIWTPEARDRLRELFDRQPEISLHRLMDEMGAARVVFEENPFIDPFFNINTQADLESAVRIAGASS